MEFVSLTIGCYDIFLYQQLERRYVEEYWSATRETRYTLQMPAQKFEITQYETECSDVDFFIELRGSEPFIEFIIPCRSQQLYQQPPTNYFINITTEMYPSGSALLAGIKGEHDGSSVKVEMDNVDCRTLITEISFRFFRWKEMGVTLGMSSTDLDSIDAMSLFYFDKAFQMLATWLITAYPVTLKTLLEALQSVDFSLVCSHWTTSYPTVKPKAMTNKFFSKLAAYIESDWKYVARFLGETESSIYAALGRSICAREQAYQMLYEWERHCVLREKEAYCRLFYRE